MKQTFNIVIPMAGLGTRFEEKGYKNKKPFIDVNGKPMIQRVIENLKMEFDPKYEFILICLQEDYEKYDFSIFDDIIGHDNWEVICLPKLTEGAAQTLLASEPYIDNDVPMMSMNSDQLVEWDNEKMFMEFDKHDGGIPCFYGEGNAWSYAGVDEDGFVTEVVEKKQVSKYATAGYYYWSKGSDFVKYAKQMIEENSRTNGEFYVAPVYSWAIKEGKKYVVGMVDEIHSLGTPEHLEEYLGRNE